MPDHVPQPPHHPDSFRVTLPYSEVCMHMRLSDKTMWVRPTNFNGHGFLGVQLINEDGTKFSFPISTGEAGLHLLPLVPPFADTMTELEVRAYHRGRQRCRDCDRRVLISSPLNDGVQDRFGRCEECAREMADLVRANESVAWDPNP